MSDPTLPLEGLSSVNGKAVIARFDGGTLSSDSGVIALAEVEKRLGVAGRLARCIDDPRRPDQIVHSLADMIGFRMKMIAAGYEDGNDATRRARIRFSRWPKGRCPRAGISPPNRGIIRNFVSGVNQNRHLAANWRQNPALQALDKAETVFTPLKATFESQLMRVSSCIGSTATNRRI
jgi:hypothetical protein